MGTKRLKLVLGEKQADVIISGLAALYSENEIRASDLADSAEAYEKQLWKELTDEMDRADKLRIKLLTMMKQGA